jgi:hypothetical protein
VRGIEQLKQTDGLRGRLASPEADDVVDEHPAACRAAAEVEQRVGCPFACRTAPAWMRPLELMWTVQPLQASFWTMSLTASRVEPGQRCEDRL